MARARRKTRQRGAGRGLPGWAMLTIGLIIGLFVAFLVYLDDLDAPPNAARVPALERGPDTDTPAADDAADTDRPRFEFYSILPELEVVVPEIGRSGPEEAGPAEPAPEPPADEPAAESAPEPAPADADGRYYLQAGSFQEAAQADRMKAEIALLGLAVGIQQVRIDGEQWHRVRVGPYGSDDALQDAQQRLRDNEIDYLVLREKAPG